MHWELKSYHQSIPTHPLPVSEKTRLVLKSWGEETQTEVLRKGRRGRSEKTAGPSPQGQAAGGRRLHRIASRSGWRRGLEGGPVEQRSEDVGVFRVL